jgi:hypothetical protein
MYRAEMAQWEHQVLEWCAKIYVRRFLNRQSALSQKPHLRAHVAFLIPKNADIIEATAPQPGDE